MTRAAEASVNPPRPDAGAGPARGLWWVVLGQGGTLLATLLLVRAATEGLPPAEYGRLGLALTAAALLNQWLLGPLAQGVVRHAQLAAERGQLAAFGVAVRRGTTQLLAGVAAFAALVGAALGLAGQAALLAPWLLAVVLALGTGAVATVAGAQHGWQARGAASAGPFAEAWLRLVLVVGVLALAGPHAEAALLAYALASWPVLWWQRAWMRRHLPAVAAPGAAAHWPPERWRAETLGFALPFMFWGPFTWAQQSVDRWALQQVAGADALGLYLAAFQLGHAPMAVAAGMAMTWLQPAVNRLADGGDTTHGPAPARRLVWRATALCVGLALVAAGIAAATHDLIFAALVGPAYRSASVWWPWLVLAGGLFAGGQMLGMQLAAQRRPRDMLGVKVGTALLAVLAMLGGAVLWGAPGVVAAQLLFALVYLLAMAVVTHAAIGRPATTPGAGIP